MEVSQVRAAVVIILLLLFNTLTTWYKVILIPETLPFNLTSRSRCIHCDGSWCKEFPSSFRTLRVPLSNKCCEHFFFYVGESDSAWNEQVNEAFQLFELSSINN